MVAWQCWCRTCGTPVWPPRPPAQGQDGLQDQGGDQEIAICCTPVIPRCQQSQRTVGNNKELRKSKRGSGNHHYRPPSGMIRKYRISDALHVHYQRPLVHLSNTQALCWEPSQDLLIHASSSQSFFSRICILFFHWKCCLIGFFLFWGNYLNPDIQKCWHMRRHVSRLTENCYSFFRGCHYGNKLPKGVDG